MSSNESKNGFIYVATLRREFLNSAKNSAFSLKEHWPEANVTLFTNDTIVDEECYEIFDQVIIDKVPYDPRAKLWALAHTPYDVTMYIDADTMIEHSDIQKTFEQIYDNDIVFTTIRPYNSNVAGFLDDPDFLYHGGVFLFTKKCIPFMKQWWDLWKKGQAGPWDYHYPLRMRKWDQFYLFYLLKHTNHGLKVGIFSDQARWNFVMGYVKSELRGKDPIITHFTIGRDS